MIYILVVVLYLGNAGGVTSFTKEFNTPQACNIAATEIRRQVASSMLNRPAVVMCTPKG